MKQSSLHAIALLFSIDLTPLKLYHTDLFIIALQFVLIFDLYLILNIKYLIFDNYI